MTSLRKCRSLNLPPLLLALLVSTSACAAEGPGSFDDKALLKSLVGTWQEHLPPGLSAQDIARTNLLGTAGGIVRFNADHSFNLLPSCTKPLPPGVTSVKGTWKLTAADKLESTIPRPDGTAATFTADILFTPNQIYLGLHGKSSPYGRYLGPVPPVCKK